MVVITTASFVLVPSGPQVFTHDRATPLSQLLGSQLLGSQPGLQDCAWLNRGNAASSVRMNSFFIVTDFVLNNTSNLRAGGAGGRPMKRYKSVNEKLK